MWLFGIAHAIKVGRHLDCSHLKVSLDWTPKIAYSHGSSSKLSTRVPTCGIHIQFGAFYKTKVMFAEKIFQERVSQDPGSSQVV